MDPMPKMVREFHTKHGYPLDVPFQHGTGMPYTRLPDVHARLALEARMLQSDGVVQQAKGDPRVYRAHLMLEELAETIKALYCGSEAQLADGLADLLYVVIGTCETFGIPTEYIFAEVHRSNMTKQVRTEENLRLRDKGPEYVAPDLEDAIRRGREMRQWRTHGTGTESESAD